MNRYEQPNPYKQRGDGGDTQPAIVGVEKQAKHTEADESADRLSFYKEERIVR
jgi:hypothetical protein